MAKTLEELQSEKETLKEKHGKVFEVTIFVDDEETESVTIFLRSLDETTYKAVNRVIEVDELAAARVLINDLYIGGDSKEIITKDFENIRAASKILGNMFKTRKASIEKLTKKK